MWTAPAGILMGIVTGDGYWYLLAGAFFVVGLIIRGTAKQGLQLAASARAAHIATSHGIQLAVLGAPTAGAILNQAMMESATLTAQLGIPLDQAFDRAYTAGLAEAINSRF